jgi:hypothetical protein
MNENRKRILEMLAAGQINAEEAERLIAALEKEPPPAASAGDTASRPDGWPKYLRVVVESDEGEPGLGPSKVNVRVPMQLLRAGVKLTSIIPPQARVKVNEALHQQGVDLDLSELKPENLEELIYQLRDLTVDIDDKKGKVRVFCE